jgi:hypothetical protein
MKLPLRRKIDEVSAICGVSDQVIIRYIEEEWVHPIDTELHMLDEEDVSRIILIQDLREKFGVNDEAIPVILHLIDQLNFIIHHAEGDHA